MRKLFATLATTITVGAVGVYGADQANLLTPDAYKLKAIPEDVMNATEYIAADGTAAVSYAYVSDDIVSQLSPSEIISKRTENSFTEDVRVEGANQLRTTFFTAPTFKKKENNWHVIEYATTTKASFDEQTAPTILERLIGPRADADDFYASADGGVEYYLGTSISWYTVRDHNGSAAVVNVDGNAFVLAVEDSTGTNRYGIARGFTPVDTSSLPDDATITTATFSLWHISKTNTDNDSFDFIVAVNSTQASTDSLDKTDYNDVGTTEYSVRTDFGSITTAEYTTHTFNATGRDAINLTGFTKIAWREGHDLLNSLIAGNKENELRTYTSSHSGTTEDPLFTITYTTPGGSPAAPDDGFFWFD